MAKQQTLGEKRVKVDFNTTDSSKVHKIKMETALLIDSTEAMREDGKKRHSVEKHRLISLAQTHYETAAMFAVKAHYTE